MKTLPVSAIACLLLSGFLPCFGQDAKIAPIKEIVIKGFALKTEDRLPKPKTIKNARELAQVIANPEVAQKLKEKVDFKSQYILLFSWGGSGKDQLDTRYDGKTVIFAYRRGLSRDLRFHLKVFVIENGVKWKVERVNR
ncbi:MAG: hypothetical protein KatS3mg105_3337 [Gemmatales bacterium]|nr:MAG: hypothetical protein KatS3mg105_3337 [Gemmatales bacterium]